MSQIKTKIIATLGPASNNPKVINQLISKGMNVARVNMGHFQTVEEFEKTVATVREQSIKEKKYVGILVDLAGPKIRLSSNNTTIAIKENEIYLLGYKSQNDITINVDVKFKKIIPGKSLVKIDDGKVIFKVLEIKNNNLQDLYYLESL